MSGEHNRAFYRRKAARRERIATQVLAGLYANSNPRTPDSAVVLAGWAVEAADALLLALAAAESEDALREINAQRQAEGEVRA